MKKLVLALLPALTLGLVACDDEQPTDADYDEVAAGLAQLVSDGEGGGDVGAMEEAVALALGDVPIGLTLSGEGAYEGVHAGLRYAYDVTCQNAAGRTMLVCDERTDAASVVISWDGDLTLPNFRGAVSRGGHWQIVGLQGAEARLDGEGSFDVSAWWRSRAGEGTYALVYDATYDAIAIDMESRAVVGGDARWVVEVERTRDGRRSDAEASFTITAELSFDEGGAALLTLDGSRHYRLELASGTVERDQEFGRTFRR